MWLQTIKKNDLQKYSNLIVESKIYKILFLKYL